VATKNGWWRRAMVYARRVRTAVMKTSEMLASGPARGALLLAVGVLVVLGVVSGASALATVDATLLAADTMMSGRRRPPAGPLVVMG